MKGLTNSKVPKIRFKGFAGEWEEAPVSNFILSLDAGVSVNAGDRPANKSEFGVLKTSAVTNGVFESDENKVVLVEDERSRLKEPVCGGTIIISRMNTPALVGANAYVESSHENLFLPDRLWAAKPREGASMRFFAVILGSDKGRASLSKMAKGTSGSMKNITKPDVLASTVRAPTPAEQTQIGGYFQEVDRLIGLQKRKHDKLVTLKKAMLRAMFPQPGTTTPEIRFKGFKGAWVEKKLGEITANVANNTLSRANLNYRSGLARNVHYGDVLIRFGEVLDAQSDGVPFVSDDAVARKLKFSNLENGDIVMADAAEDETVGKCTEVQNVGDQIVLAGLHTIALRPLSHFAPFFLGYYLNSDAFHVQLLPIMQGTKVLSISKTAIKQTVICFPTEEAEQQKIGHYFRTLDELISKHALQLAKLKQLKSACLERMFV